MHGRLVDGALQEAPLDYILDDGSVIFNFRNKSELLSQYSFKEITE